MRDRDVGADVEEVVLDPPQPLGVAVGEPAARERDAELRVELVDGAVGLDPRVRLGHPAHVAEVGLAAVAEAGVDAREVDGHAPYRITRTRVGGQGSRCESGADPPLSPGKPAACVCCEPLVRHRTGKARRGRPGSQETSLRPQARSPRGRGGSLHLHRRSAGLAAGLLTLVLAAPAVAAPVTVDLRIEGKERTLYEGPVTVDVRTFRFTGDVEHRCDTTQGDGAPGSAPAPTRGGVVTQAAEQAGFSLRGTWSDQYASPTIDEVAGEDVRFSGGKFLGEYKNGQFAAYGSCGDQVGPATACCSRGPTAASSCSLSADRRSAKPGESVTVKATRRRQRRGGRRREHRQRGDGRRTATAVVGPLTQRGNNDLKATRPGAIRSNRVRVCVSDGADGACGTTMPGGTPRRAGGRPRHGRAGRAHPRDPRRPALHAPQGPADAARHRVAGSVRPARRQAQPDPLLRRPLPALLADQGALPPRPLRPPRCTSRSATAADWSYLLPKRLGKGRYVLDAIAIDKRRQPRPARPRAQPGGVLRPMRRAAPDRRAAVARGARDRSGRLGRADGGRQAARPAGRQAGQAHRHPQGAGRLAPLRRLRPHAAGRARRHVARAEDPRLRLVRAPSGRRGARCS